MTTPHPRRRFFRYSLRTLFIVVTVFCVWMGIISKQAREQGLAVEAIQELGGEVVYEHESTSSDPPGPEWLRRLIGDEYFFSVHGVDLKGWRVNTDSLPAISISRLIIEGLGIGRGPITDAGLVNLQALTKLKVLDLSGTQITDTGLKHLKGLTNLEELYIGGPEITDAGLEHLKGLTKMQMLAVITNNITDAGLEHLRGMTRLHSLGLSSTQITDAGLEHMKGLTRLSFLGLSSTKVTDAGLVHLEGLTGLKPF